MTRYFRIITMRNGLLSEVEYIETFSDSPDSSMLVEFGDMSVTYERIDRKEYEIKTRYQFDNYASKIDDKKVELYEGIKGRYLNLKGFISNFYLDIDKFDVDEIDYIINDMKEMINEYNKYQEKLEKENE